MQRVVCDLIHFFCRGESDILAIHSQAKPKQMEQLISSITSGAPQDLPHARASLAGQITLSDIFALGRPRMAVGSRN